MPAILSNIPQDMSGTLLIVDDDPVQGHLTESMARRFGYEARVLGSGEEALALLGQPGRGGVDALILDLVMPDLDGFAVLERLRKTGIALPVIVQTGTSSLDTVNSAMKNGATDFLEKPVTAERFQVAVRNALKSAALASEVRRVHRRKTGTLTFDDLTAQSAAMQAAIALGQRAAASHIPVLLEGETGVGKEVFARALHASGERADKPFIAVSCAAIPASLIDSLLFGHERGAFTGAVDRHAGKMLEAQGGTLFLDDVDALPPETQAKLLRVLEDHEVEPVGGKKPVPVDVRLVSATAANLIDLVKKGRFREDLYYRLGVFPVGLPPLRSRRADIRPLARAFLARFSAEEGRVIRGIAPAALSLIEDYAWPGNVRQLENAIFRAVVLSESDELGVAEFPQIAAAKGLPPTLIGHAPQPQVLRAPALLPPPALLPERATPFHVLALTDGKGHARPLEEIERETIRHALTHYEGQMTEVARRLGIGRSTLYRKLKELDLSVELCDLADTRPPEEAA